MRDLKGSKPIPQNTSRGNHLQASTTQPVPVVIHDPQDDPTQLDLKLDDGLTVLYYDCNYNPTPSSTGKDKGRAQGFRDKRAIVIPRDFIQSKISPSAAASAILDLLLDDSVYVKSGAVGNAARGEHWGLAGFLVDMATQIPYNHPAQAKLVQLIERISESKKVGSMEQLAIHLYETFGGIGELDDTEGQLPGDPFAQALDIVGFFARLSASGSKVVSSSHGVQILRDCLEMKPNVNKNARYADLMVCMAAVWAMLAGQTLYTQVVEAPISDRGAPAYYDTKELYSGPRFGLARWTFWREGLKDAAYGKSKLTEQSKGLARIAVGLMEFVEESRICN